MLNTAETIKVQNPRCSFAGSREQVGSRGVKLQVRGGQPRPSGLDAGRPVTFLPRGHPPTYFRAAQPSGPRGPCPGAAPAPPAGEARAGPHRLQGKDGERGVRARDSLRGRAGKGRKEASQSGERPRGCGGHRTRLEPPSKPAPPGCGDRVRLSCGGRPRGQGPGTRGAGSGAEGTGGFRTRGTLPEGETERRGPGTRGAGRREVGRPGRGAARAATPGKDIAAGAHPPRWGPGLARLPPPPPPPARPRICSRQTRRCPPDGSARTAYSGPWRGLGARSAGSAPDPTSDSLRSEPARGREAAARHYLHLLRAQPPPPAHFRPTPEPEAQVEGGTKPFGMPLKALCRRSWCRPAPRPPPLFTA